MCWGVDPITHRTDGTTSTSQDTGNRLDFTRTGFEKWDPANLQTLQGPGRFSFAPLPKIGISGFKNTDTTTPASGLTYQNPVTSTKPQTLLPGFVPPQIGVRRGGP